MAIETVDTNALAEQADNLYESVVILSRRARQVATRTKAELDQKLSYFDDLSLEPGEDLRANEDQFRISLEYERKPKPAAVAIQEMKTGELYWRTAAPEENPDGGAAL